MLLQFLLISCAAFTIVNGNCSPCGPAPKHYEELGCRGEWTEQACCPTRYECPDLTALDSNFCHLNGKTYQKGETVSKDDSPPCVEDCVCAESGNGDLHFVCPIKECPEVLGMPEKDCVHKYSLDRCCSVDKLCGAEIESLQQCHFRGETFNYGQKFNPRTIFAPCHECICDENFNSSIAMEMYGANKNCKKVNCGMVLSYQDAFKNVCTPIYYKDTNCCPIGFRCPSASDTILPLEGLPEISSVRPNTLCTFGTLTLQRGQSIATDEKCLECKCRIPPMIDCIIAENCA